MKCFSFHKFIRSNFYRILLLAAFLFSFQCAVAQENVKVVNPKSGMHVEKNNGTNPVPFSTCSGLGGEGGWGTWQAADGYFQSGNPAPVFFAPGAPVAPRFTLTSGAGVDPCTVGTTGPTIP